jgi:precorrin-6B C5,15-methyltransferase / cobalt-precorrin-6B C5,C15-methyltransferase
VTWLTIVGIGEDGLAGLGEAARAAVARADHVFGGTRHLELAAPVITGATHPWQSPFSASIDAILARRGQSVCVLASGDPFHHGVGATLSRHVDASQMQVYPQPSSFSLAAARLGWPLQDVLALSLHGRPLDLIRPHLHPGARILALTSDEHGPAQLAALLTEAGFGISSSRCSKR